MIDVFHTGPLGGSAIERQITQGEVILQVQDRPDREYPEVRWRQYGIVPTNEVCVTASLGQLAYFSLALSWLDVPGMADRVFGTDIMDVQLAQELAGALWGRYGAELVALALRQRVERA